MSVKCSKRRAFHPPIRNTHTVGARVVGSGGVGLFGRPSSLTIVDQ